MLLKIKRLFNCGLQLRSLFISGPCIEGLWCQTLLNEQNIRRSELLAFGLSRYFVTKYQTQYGY